ncbi:sodium/proton-translocating pyrophosphatase, partial [Janibacter sp. RAF20_2_2]
MAVTLATLSTASSIDLDGTNLGLVGGVAVIGLLALVLGVVLRGQVLTAGAGTPRMQEIAGAVEEGAHAYLRRQFRTLLVFVALVFVLLLFLPADSSG